MNYDNARMKAYNKNMFNHIFKGIPIDEQSLLDNEFDTITERADMNAELIAHEITLLRTHDDLCELILEQNADLVWIAIKSGKDVVDKLNGLIDRNLENEAMRRLKL